MSSYISYPLDTNVDNIVKTIYTFIKTRAPEWLENNNNLDTWIIQAIAREGADLRDLASNVPAAIFRWFGRTLIGLPPQDAVPAVATATITVVDTQGYTIRAGAFIGIRNSVGDTIAFELQNDVVIPVGLSSSVVGEASLVAVTPGVGSSGIGGAGVAASLIDPPLAYVNSILLVGPTAGGIDAEDNDEYQDKLASYLRLLSTRPILADDFVIRARLITGVYRAAAIDNYIPAVNEQQRLTMFNATGGTFTITWSGQTTAAIAYNASAAAIQAALEALSNIDPGDISSTGGPINTTPVVTDFIGPKGGANQPAMTVDTTALTGGGAGITVTTLRDGSAVVVNAEKAVAVSGIDAVGSDLSSDLVASIKADLQSNRELGFIVNVINPTRTNVDITFQAKAIVGYSTSTALANATAALTDYLSPVKWGRDPRYTDAAQLRTWVETLNVRLYNIAQIIENSEGIDYILPGTLTLGKNGGAQAAADLALTGPFALTAVGTITGTVT